MKSAAITLMALCLAVASIGCECEDDWFDDDDCWFGGDCDRSCSRHNDCDDEDECTEPQEECTEDAECVFGFCDPLSQTCQRTGLCSDDADCAEHGPAMACDQDRHVCVPDEGPCPDGHCGCADDDECGDGLLCINSLCTDLSTVCVFDLECGDGLCLNNQCHARCDDGACPSGQSCQSGLCMGFDGPGPDGCTFDEDCVGGACIDGGCYATCEDSEGCGQGEACVSGVCRADAAPIRQCESDDACEDGRMCLRGVCRLPCVAHINCVDTGMGICGDDGLCLDAAEMSTDCSRAADCGPDQVCKNGICAEAM